MKKSFTLIEAIIVISVITLLVGLSSLSLVNYGEGSDKASAQTIVVQALREAQSNALANIDDNPWGVHIDDHKIVVFQDTGSGYNPSDSNNRNKIISDDVTLSSNINDFLFDKGLGTTPNQVVINVNTGGLTSQVILNTQGMIDY